MAIRIEYLLMFMLVVLLLSILGINPTSQAAKSSKGDKEIEFQNFSVYDIKQNAAAQEMFAVKTIKYQNYLEMDEIDLKDETGYRLLAKKAIYENEYVYMDRGVHVLRDDGLKFSTKSLNYNVDTKDIRTVKPFILEFNSSIIQGQNLVLNMNSRKISADNIEAKIVFVSADKNITPK
jgi:LPS export ABC transporter protein LptC